MLHRSQRMTTTLSSRLQSTCKHACVDEGGLRTLKEAYSRQKPEVQCAFKILMIHEVLQFDGVIVSAYITVPSIINSMLKLLSSVIIDKGRSEAGSSCTLVPKCRNW